MDKTIKMNFPDNCGTGYVFAGFKTKKPVDRIIEFLKQEGDFLDLNEECKYRDNDTRKTEICSINGEVVIKLRYNFFETSLRRDAAQLDAKAILEQIENLLIYAEEGL